MSYENGSCQVTTTYTGLNGFWEQTTTWANENLLDEIMERANPRRKNGRVKAVTVSVAFFYRGKDKFGNTWGPRLDQGYMYIWLRPDA